MKIALVTDTFLPQINGIATYVANIAEELGRRGHEVLIIAPKIKNPHRKKFSAKNVKVVEVVSVPVDFLYTEFKVPVMGFPKVLSALNDFKPDLIHFQMPLPLGVDSILCSKILNIPLVSTLHTFMTASEYLLVLMPEKFANKPVTDFIMNLSNFMYSAADLRISVSKELITELKKSGYRKEVKYIPSCVLLPDPENKKHVDVKALKKKLGLRTDLKTVLHFGRISGEKMVGEVIEAFSKMKTKDSQLLIIGDGPVKKDLEGLVKELDLEKRVVFTGFIDHQELVSSGILYVGDVFITASTTENNPMVALESMAHGLPLIAPAAGGLKSLVDGNGFLVDPHDVEGFSKSLDLVLSDPKLHLKFSKKSLLLAEERSVENVVTKLLVEYKKAIQKKQALRL